MLRLRYQILTTTVVALCLDRCALVLPHDFTSASFAKYLTISCAASPAHMSREHISRGPVRSAGIWNCARPAFWQQGPGPTNPCSGQCQRLIPRPYQIVTSSAGSIRTDMRRHLSTRTGFRNTLYRLRGIGPSRCELRRRTPRSCTVLAHSWLRLSAGL